MKKIGYIGYQGFGNLGDELLYDAHKLLFKRLHVYGSRSGILRNLIRFKEGLISPDAYLLGGGTLINSTKFLLDECKRLSKADTALFCLGSGVCNPDFWGHVDPRDEPYGAYFDQWLDVLKTFRFIGVRGPYSLKTLTDNGIENAQLVGDPVLAFAGTPETGRRKERVIGINVGQTNYELIWGRDEKALYDKMVDVVSFFLRDGYEVKVFPVCQKDMKFCENLYHHFNHSGPNGGVTLCAQWDNFEAYRRELSTCRLFIGEKLHSVVLSTLEGIPSIMVEYRPKCRDYMASIGHESLCVKTSDITVDKIVELSGYIDENYNDIVCSLRENIGKLKHQLENAVQEIEDLALG